MADTELNIKVTTDSKEIQALVLALNKGTMTVGEYNKAIRQLRADSIVGSEEQMALKSVVEQVGDATATENGKVMKSYFSTGEELRRFYREQRLGDRTMREATQTIGGFASMLGGEGVGKVVGSATGAFQQMEFAVHGLGIAAQTGTPKMQSMGQTLMSYATPLAIAAAGFGLLAIAMKYLSDITDTLNKALDKNTELLIKSGKIPKEQSVEMLTKQIITNEQKTVSPDFWTGLLSVTAMAQKALTANIEKMNTTIELTEKRKQVEKEITEELNKQKDTQSKAIQTIGSAAEINLSARVISERTYREELDKEIFALGPLIRSNEDLAHIASLKLKQEESITRELREQEGIFYRVRTNGIKWLKEERDAELANIKLMSHGRVQSLGPISSFGSSGMGRLKASKVPGISEDPEAWSNKMSKTIDVTFGDMMTAGMAFQDSFMAGIGSMTSAVGDKLGGAFASVFGGAQTLLGGFVNSFVSALSNMAMQVASAGIFNTIFPSLGLLGGFHFQHGGVINEPVIGQGMRSGRPYTFAETGPEKVIPMAQSSRFSNRSSGGGMQPIVLETRIRGKDIVLVQATSSRAIKNRSL